MSDVSCAEWKTRTNSHGLINKGDVKRESDNKRLLCSSRVVLQITPCMFTGNRTTPRPAGEPGVGDTS